MRRGCTLPDVNLLLAYGWQSHGEHKRTREWFARLARYATCAITELGFLRVSMSPAYRANGADVRRVLESLTGRRGAVFLECGVPVSEMGAVTSYKDVTDCYLVELARRNGCRFATLDEGILKAEWAKGVAFHPFR